MASAEFKLAILASGNGSTSELMLASPDLVSAVISNRPEAGILQRALKHGVHAIYLTRRQHQVTDEQGQIDPVLSDRRFQSAILNSLRQLSITHVAQQGWMVKTGADIIDHYYGRLTNSHPGPLDPGYLDLGGTGMHGLAVHKSAIDIFHQLNGRFQTGPTLHLVDHEYDHGAILAFRPVTILPDDTPETLAARVKPIEAQQSLDFWLKVRNTGHIQPFTRDQRLFHPTDYPLIEHIKTAAIEHYRH